MTQIKSRGSMRGREAVSWGPGRSIKIRRRGVRGVRAVRSRSDEGNQTRERDMREAAPLLFVAVRSPELRQARARVALGSLELGRGE
jgi:hypothetical protein